MYQELRKTNNKSNNNLKKPTNKNPDRYGHYFVVYKIVLF